MASSYPIDFTRLPALTFCGTVSEEILRRANALVGR
jgi:hypothetical protein